MKQIITFCLTIWLMGVVSVVLVNGQVLAEPPAPKPSAAVQTVLDEAAQWMKDKQPQEALKAADRALAVAREVQDPVGEERVPGTCLAPHITTLLACQTNAPEARCQHGGCKVP